MFSRREYLPCASLATYIKSYWFLDDNTQETPGKCQFISPSSFPELIFYFTNKDAKLFQIFYQQYIY
ncbi:MAG: DUF6597 domain-containing transcriptional factor [bacterium]